MLVLSANKPNLGGERQTLLHCCAALGSPELDDTMQQPTRSAGVSQGRDRTETQTHKKDRPLCLLGLMLPWDMDVGDAALTYPAPVSRQERRQTSIGPVVSGTAFSYAVTIGISSLPAPVPQIDA